MKRENIASIATHKTHMRIVQLKRFDEPSVEFDAEIRISIRHNFLQKFRYRARADA
jgi:hypothetical protein